MNMYLGLKKEIKKKLKKMWQTHGPKIQQDKTTLVPIRIICTMTKYNKTVYIIKKYSCLGI